MSLFLALLAMVAAIVVVMRTRWGERIGDFAPTPFWIYFIPILFATFGIFPHESPVYDAVSLRALPAALALMLIGTPLRDLFRMSSKAMQAIFWAAVTMTAAALVSYVIMIKFLPKGSDEAVGALLGTWVGGSANMLAVKEILQMPDSLMSPLIIVDTFLSYAWMALLVFGAGWQGRYDQWAGASFEDGAPSLGKDKSATRSLMNLRNKILVLVVGLLVGEVAVRLGVLAGSQWAFLSSRGWTIILISIVALTLAATPLQKLGTLGASQVGGYLLYLVLATIGVKTSLQAAREAPVFILFGALILVIHGVLLLLAGRWKKLPLFLLSTASQAAVGGPVSAPIVAEVYRPGTSPIGVLMALLGALAGTYVGLLGTWICRGLNRIFL